MQTFWTRLFVLVVVLAYVTVDCLTIEHNKQVEHFFKDLQERISHQLCDSLHLKDKDDKQILHAQLMAFISSDSELLGEIKGGGALSQKSAKKIKNFIVGNDKLVNQIFDSPHKDLTNDNCMSKLNLTQEKKKKLVSVILDAIDLQKNFNSKQHSNFTPAQVKKMKDAITAEPTLGPQVVKCIKKN